MPSGYASPILMINAGVNAYNAGSNPTPSVIKGVRHLRQITGDVIWVTGVTAGKVVIDIVPTQNFPDSEDGEIIFQSDVAADSLVTPISQHFSYPGIAAYIRHRIVTDVSGGGAPSVTTYLDGLV